MKSKRFMFYRKYQVQSQFFKSLLLFLFSVAAPQAYSHAYMDLAISELWLDNECHLNVKIINEGGSLPDHFYFSAEPAKLHIAKGQQQETSGSFSQLDSQRKLTTDQNSLIIKSTTVFANNAKPVTATIHYGTEFGDFNQRNDSLTRAMNCQIGVGQMAGDAVEYSTPDIAIGHVSINEDSCKLKLELINKTGVALSANSWSAEQGVALMIKDTDTGKRKHFTALATIDPKKQFTRKAQALSWQSDFEITQIQHATVAIWYVTGDNDFANNEQTIDVPPKCINKK